MSTPANTAPSKRWTHFHSALQLAVQRASHKWTFEDFAECFPLWCKEAPDGATSLHNTIATHMEADILQRCEDLFEQYEAQENIDRLHTVVTEARERRQQSYNGEDLWREDLPPRAAVRARTIPVLEEERDRLREKLAQMEERNMELQTEMQESVRARDAADAETGALLDFLEECLKKWQELPIEEMQRWALEVDEAAPEPL